MTLILTYAAIHDTGNMFEKYINLCQCVKCMHGECVPFPCDRAPFQKLSI